MFNFLKARRRLQHGRPARGIENRMEQRNRQQLIRTAGAVVAVGAIDDIEEMFARVEPEAAVERLAHAVGQEFYRPA